MGKIDKQNILINTGVLYIRMFLVMAIALYTSRVVLQVLGVEDFGIYTLLGSVVSLFFFINGALNTSTSRYFAFELGKKISENLKSTFETAFTIHLVISFVVLILLEVLGVYIINNFLVIPEERLYSANLVFQFSVFSTIVSLLQVPSSALILASEKIKIYAFMDVFQSLLKLGGVLLLGFSSYDYLVTYSFIVFIVSVVVFIIYQFYCSKNYSEYSIRLCYRPLLFKEMLSFSGWGMVGSLSTVLKLQGVNVLLNLFFGPAVNAARGVAYQVNGAVSGFTLNFTTALRPQIIKHYAAVNIPEMSKLIFQGCKFSYFLLFILGFPVIVEADFLLSLWLFEVPDYAVIFTQLVIANAIVESFNSSIYTGIQAAGKIKKYQIVVGSFNLLNLPISFAFLTYGFDAKAVFIVSICISSCLLFLRVFFLKKIIPEIKIKNFVYEAFLPSIKVTLSSFLAVYFLAFALLNRSADHFVFFLLSIASVLLATWFLGLSKGEREYLLTLLKKKLAYSSDLDGA